MTNTQIKVPFPGVYSFDALAEEILQSLKMEYPWPWVPFQVPTKEIGCGRFVVFVESDVECRIDESDLTLVVPIDDELPGRLEIGGIIDFELLWPRLQDAALEAVHRSQRKGHDCAGPRYCRACFDNYGI